MNAYQFDSGSGVWHREGFTGIAYSDGQEFERELLRIVRESTDLGVFSSEFPLRIRDWRGEYHLTPQRHCLVRPVPFNAGESVLELGCGCGAITRHLGERGLNVTAVEGGALRASITSARCRDLPNVKVILEDLVSLESEQRFDWVTLIGVLEYSPTFAAGPDPVLAYLRQALRYLKPGGRLVLAIENRLGLKYFNGCGEDHVGRLFFGINDLYDGKSVITFGRVELENKLIEAGCRQIDFFYPFPDYKLPSVVVAEEAFRHADFKVADLLMRTESRDYGGRQRRVFSEQLVARSLERNGLLRDFSNSFLVIASPAAGSPPRSQSPKTLAWAYSIGRRAGFRTETVFEEHPGDDLRVTKRLVGPPSEPLATPLLHRLSEHSAYVAGSLMAWDVLKAKLHPDPAHALCRAFEPYARHLLSISQPRQGLPHSLLEAWHLPGSQIDCTPFNLIVTASGLVEIDDEWRIPGEIATGWVLLRAIVQTVAMGPGSAALQNIALADLLTGVCGALGLQFEAASIGHWLQLEAQFLEQATGRRYDLVTASTPLSALGSVRLVDLDQAGGALPQAAQVVAEPMQPDDVAYHHWMNARALAAADGERIADLIARSWTTMPRIHLVVRVDGGHTAALAETLESLNFQLYGNWHMDIVATSAAPGEAFENLSSLCWHRVERSSEMAGAIDLVVAGRGCDWILEIPPGAILDPLCLLRIAHQVNVDAPANGCSTCIGAYFMDDDSVDAQQIRRSPRFKPDFDPEWTLCADLLGPLCVSAQAWSAAGGAAANAIRPWYDLGLRVVESCGPDAVGHIAAPLISYPASMRADHHAAVCADAVRRALVRRKSDTRVVRTSQGSWRTDPDLIEFPYVTIAIPSRDKPEYLVQCIDALVSLTIYPDYEILIVDAQSTEPETRTALAAQLKRSETPVRCITLAAEFNLATFANAAAQAACGDYLMLLSDDLRVTSADWLNVLVSHALRPEIACVAPILLTPPDATVDQAGTILGLGGFAGGPHQGHAHADDGGYLDCLRVNRSVAALPGSCMLVRRQDFLDVRGMDADHLGAGHADIDFCLRLTRSSGRRSIVAANATLVRLGGSSLDPLAVNPIERAEIHAAELRAQATVLERWFDDFACARYWSKHLDRSRHNARIEVSLVPSWHVLPDDTPRIMAFPVNSAQGTIRLGQPLAALKRAGKAQTCVFSPSLDSPEIPSVQDLARHAPDVMIAHQLIGSSSLRMMREWRRLLRNAFRVYTLDDLLTAMPRLSSLRLGVPADARSYLSRILRECDRLVVSTDYLAQAYGHLAADTRVVPNRLERDAWLALGTQRGSGQRPRVGWAGGTAHEGDLQQIAEVVGATAGEVDWVFMGMCPESLRPHIREFHPFGPIEAYPARLAALNLDLAVAPLEEIPFNCGKSNLRLLEYGVLGIPVVCTNIEPYRDSPACKVANHPRAWIEALRERIRDPDAAAREGEAMRAWVLEHFILEDHLDSWLEAHLPD